MFIKDIFMRIIHPKSFWMAASEMDFCVNILNYYYFFHQTNQPSVSEMYLPCVMSHTLDLTAHFNV